MWWFKRATLRPTFADAQAMHPWFLEYQRLEPGVKELVWTLNQTDLVETLSSCQGHPEMPEWWETTGGTAYVLHLVINPSRWEQVLEQLQQLAKSWTDVELLVRNDEESREQWLAFQVRYGPPEACRAALDKAIGQANELVKEYLDHDLVALATALESQAP